MSKFIKLALLQRDFSKTEIPYQFAINIREDGSFIKVQKVIWDEYTKTIHDFDREPEIYATSDAIAINHLRSVLELKPRLLVDLTKILASQPEILAAIQPCATHDSKIIDTAAEDIPETPSLKPVLCTLGSQDSELSTARWCNKK